MSDVGHGGWFGDPEGHAEAARLGWFTRRRDRLETVGADAYARHSQACNQAAAAIAADLGCDDLDDMTANEQVAFVEANWRSITAKDAHERAQRGELVVAGLANPKGHGHVAVVYPGAGAVKPDGNFYPNVVCGGLNVAGRSDGSKTAGDVWNRRDRGKVKYYVAPPPPTHH